MLRCGGGLNNPLSLLVLDVGGGASGCGRLEKRLLAVGGGEHPPAAGGGGGNVEADVVDNECDVCWGWCDEWDNPTGEPGLLPVSPLAKNWFLNAPARGLPLALPPLVLIPRLVEYKSPALLPPLTTGRLL